MGLMSNYYLILGADNRFGTIVGLIYQRLPNVLIWLYAIDNNLYLLDVLVNQACAALWPALAWFLKTVFDCNINMCVFVPAP